MNCPIDATPLAMIDRSGVEIDCCPTCRGVWLDRGELDRIIERAGAHEPLNVPHDADRRSRWPQGGRKHLRLREPFGYGD